MKVMVIVKATKESEAGRLPDEKGIAEMGTFKEELVKAGVMLSGVKRFRDRRIASRASALLIGLIDVNHL
jgi:hypothetical protein